jgi:hypothetical protein
MRKFFSFWWLCAKRALRGNAPFANDWQWLFGYPAIAIVIWLIGAYYAELSGRIEVTLTTGAFGAFVAAVIAYVITWLVSFFVRLANAPVTVFHEQKDRANKLEQQLSVHGSSEQEAYPDWRIDELFTRIRPDLLQRTDAEVGDTWDEVGSEVKDAFSLGRLSVWGRQVKHGPGTILGERQSLRPISPNYWHVAHFTYSFFDNTAGDAPHTYVEDGHSEVTYTDLRVNRAQALTIWPLEIIFDPSNPARRFWSMESPRDENDNKRPGAFWEYRVEIKNNSQRTVRNVSVTVEHTGGMPLRPVDSIFDKNRKTSCDLKPGCSELIPIIRWPIPAIQAGMLAGSTALEYGPVTVMASADDARPTMRIFKFDYQAEPMLFN